MRWLITLVFLLQLPLAALPQSAAHFLTAQTDPVITLLDPQSKFGDRITFRVRVQPVDEVSELVVFITPEGQSTVWQKIKLNPVNDQGEYDQVVKARQLVLFPFSQVAYRFEASLKDGRSVSSDTQTFVYADDRFAWQNLETGIFQIHWNSTDATLGQEIANIAQEGIQHAQSILDVNPPKPLRIYAYSSASELQTALQLTDQPWVAGHATPELSMVMISIPSGPEKTLELRRQIPHELMHILQYQVMGKTYTQQPVWLVEGMASLAELSENPDYRTVLRSTPADKLIPFRSLCVMFPREAASAFQAYAQSESFVGFLQQKFGNTGLRKLIDTYKNGVGCEEGVPTALGLSLSQLEYRWEQEALGINVTALAFTNLLPYLLIGLLILVPAALVFFPRRRSVPNALAASEERP